MRQRRRDLALAEDHRLRATAAGAAVAWQATIAAVVGIVVGIPLGIVVGRWLWDLFAEQIYAVPYPTVSVPRWHWSPLGTLVLANLVAALPARARRAPPPRIMLRAE